MNLPAKDFDFPNMDTTALTSDEKDERNKYIQLKIFDEPEKSRKIFETEAGTSQTDSFYSNIPSTSIYPNEDKILGEIEGVIDRIGDKKVRVKLFPNNYVNFPHVLFEDRQKIRIGQHVKYIVKMDSEGYRHQHILPIENKKPHPDKELIFDLLNDFKYKNE
jgi:hypothetical protein